MKKLMLIMVCLLCIVSCQKEEIPQEKEVKINFSLQETKTLTTSAINSALNKNLPSSLELTLTNVSTKEEITMETGKSKSLPLGTYDVYCRKIGQSNTTLWSSPTIYTSDAPTLKIDTQITITYDKTEYSVTASYDCFALVIDTGDAQNITCHNFDCYFSSYSNAKATFITADLSNGAEFVVSPQTGPYQQMTYKLYTSGTHADGYKVENGKYYVLHAYEITDLDSGVITYDVDDWIEGSL